ncbi:hypothetical protein [Hwangdonia sp.]|uniref:hypothetical protein n=1 Tax=Hwangdonia sp. TaxID=1883432 RepID=UPI003AB1360F
MNPLKNILTYINFPENDFNLDFKKSLDDNADSQGFINVNHFNVNSEFIEYFVYRRREKEEYWNSIDIFIQRDKIDDFLKNLIPEKELDFKKMENNEYIYELKVNSFIRLEVIKIENHIVIQITKFDNNNFKAF